jgi:hypothetical protein
MEHDALVKWLHAQRSDLLQEIAKLQMRCDVYGEMIEKINSEPKQKPRVVNTGTKVVLKRTKKVNSVATQQVMLALEAAGKDGLTGKELAAVAQMPIGTASSRLSILKSEGRVAYDSPRYFVLHSKQEDNNV